MKLSQCKHGVLVKFNIKGTKDIIVPEGTFCIGMVVGLGQNATGEAIPIVQFQRGDKPSPCHHELLELYEE